LGAVLSQVQKDKALHITCSGLTQPKMRWKDGRFRLSKVPAPNRPDLNWIIGPGYYAGARFREHLNRDVRDFFLFARGFKTNSPSGAVAKTRDVAVYAGASIPAKDDSHYYLSFRCDYRIGNNSLFVPAKEQRQARLSIGHRRKLAQADQ